MDLGFGKDMYSYDKNWRVTEKDIIFKDVEMNITLRKYKHEKSSQNYKISPLGIGTKSKGDRKVTASGEGT